MKRIIVISILLIFSYGSFAQDGSVSNYKRSSIYQVLVTNEKDCFYYDIMDEYDRIGISDKFNEHSLGVNRLLYDHEPSASEIALFLEQNQVAKRVVARWFDRNKTSGTFDLSLIQERGYYNASTIDVAVSGTTLRGNAMLADAGEELIENTFVTVNYISYIDKERNAEIATNVFKIIAAGASSLAFSSTSLNPNISTISQLVSVTSSLGGAISDLIAGFTVKITTYLYKLEWNDDIAGEFYDRFWCDDNLSPVVIAGRKKAFEMEKGLFKLKYISSYSDKSQKTVLKGLYDSRDVIRKVCARAIDKNIAELQKQNDVFKIKAPIIEVSQNGKNIIANIGLKEAVSSSSKFEVLEVSVDDNGKTQYRRVGTIAPVEGKIWDNRYMALEEDAAGASLPGTTFTVLTGAGFYPGMLIREIKK